MIPAIGSIPAISTQITNLNPTTPTSTVGSSAAAGSTGASFGNMLANAVDALQNAQQASNVAATGVAAGTGSIGDAMIAASQASLDTQVAVALRNGVVSSISQIMATQF